MADGQRRIRIGIDTGGTFTDVVAVDEETGELVTTKTPSTPADPADGFLAGVDKVLGLLDRDGRRRSPRSATAPRSPPTSCSRARSSASASSPPRATSSSSRSPGSRCPTATATPTSGSSRRGSSPPTGCAPSAAGWTSRATRSGRSTRRTPCAAARCFRDAGITTIGVCFLHSYANAAHERAMRDVLRREHPDAVVSICSRGAARVPRVRAVGDHAGRRRGQAQRRRVRRPTSPPGSTSFTGGAADPVLRDEVQRRRALGRRGRAPADHHRAVRPGRRRAGRGADRPARPASTGCSPATAAARRPTSRSSSTASRR